jgi:hypothetical protein
MNYQEKENAIVSYVEDNFNTFNDNLRLEHFINEFLDLDQYNFNSSLWFSFDGYTYEDLTNQSKLETSTLRVFIVVRNDKEKDLHERLRSYAGSFYNMFVESGLNFGGAVDTGIITSVNFYDAVEGDKGKKLCELALSLLKETI